MTAKAVPAASLVSARPLRLIVTRPAAQAAPAVAELAARGVDAVAVPLIRILPIADPAPIAALWSALPTHRLVVFVSANAVLHFFAARPAGVVWPSGTLAAAPGPGTADALRAEGVADASLVTPDPVAAAQFDSEALWQLLKAQDWQGASVVVVRGDGGRDWLADRLAAAGATVHALAAYQRALPLLAPAAAAIVDAAIAESARSVWLFSSSEAIANLEAIGGVGRWSTSRAIATHPRIAGRARQAGFAEVRESKPGLDAVVACIQSMQP